MIILCPNMVRLITNITPLCAVSLAVTVPYQFAAYLRAFLQRYLSNQLYLRVKLVRNIPGNLAKY